jgi:predicted acyl esterase
MDDLKIGRRTLLMMGAAGALAGGDGVQALAEAPATAAPALDPWKPIRAACAGHPVDPIWRVGVPPEHAREILKSNKPAWPGADYAVIQDEGLYIERNVKIPLRDGLIVYGDLFRPDDARRDTPLPVLISWSPYGKHQPQTHRDGDGIDPAWVSKYSVWENPSPGYFVKEHGYAMLLCDSKGSWGSQGDETFFDQADAEAFYDAIEWAGTQPWCNGKVGTMGVSSYTMNQWRVAALNPPHLAAILPWEGSIDLYRERNYRGGIRENHFIPSWSHEQTVSRGRVEDWLANQIANPLVDCYYSQKQPDFSRVTVPAFVGASWSDQGIHTRGTLQGYRLISSKQKWLLIHGRNKWGTFTSPEMREKQRIFYDHFLKGQDGGLMSWPPVQMDIRDRAHVQAVALRPEKEFPLARTRYVKLHLDAANGSLSRRRPAAVSKVSYNTDNNESTHFDIKFDRDTEITGYASLRLWVETPTETEMDMFVALQKLDVHGDPVGMEFASTWDGGPVALGWLRASHQALDHRCSTPQQPVHLHTRSNPLTPGKPIPLDIEIWPSGTLFRAGESLRVVVKGSDIYDKMPPSASIILHESHSKGVHVLHTGGRYASYLLAPYIPPKMSRA